MGVDEARKAPTDGKPDVEVSPTGPAEDSADQSGKSNPNEAAHHSPGPS
jgi:hypothetical protein